MISILIPIKNEPYINKLVDNIRKVVKREHEIIIIDKSKVQTNIPGVKIIRQISRGLGNAVLEGLKKSRGDTIVVMDGDGSHRPEDIPKLLDKIGEFDIAIGSRFTKGGKTNDPQHRRIISLFFRKFASHVLNIKVEDSMSGFAAMKKKIFDDIILRPFGYKIIMEIIFKSRKSRIYEVPIIFERRKMGKGNVGINIFGILEAFRILLYIFELRIGIR